MGNYKRLPIVFNLDNPFHEELYDWCTSQSTNFSDFVRTVLFFYMQIKTADLEEVILTGGSLQSKSVVGFDRDAMSDLL